MSLKADISSDSAKDLYWMQCAYKLALRAQDEGEVPVGAVLVKDNSLIGEGWNTPIKSNDPTAHAEIMALRSAAQTIQNYRLVDTVLYVTLEPCVMCAGAIVHARVHKVVYAACDPRTGAAGSVYSILDSTKSNHIVKVEHGVLEMESSTLLKQFFKNKRQKSC